MPLRIASYILAPLAVGSLIYAYRFNWVDVPITLPVWVIYTLPDFLWLYALLQSMRLIWGTEKWVWFWLTLCTLFAVLSEIFQLLHIIPGTFDYLDICAYLLAFLLVSIHTSIPQFKSFQYENTH